MGAPIARRVVVSGRVQGVFFRNATRRETDRLGVTGWVRNRPDGTVQAHVEGPPAAVAELVRWCEHGPRRASVAQLCVSDAAPEGHARFETR